MSEAHDPAAVVTYPRDAVLTIEQVALGLQLPVSRVEKMDLPTAYCGKRHRRYLWGQVLDAIAERASQPARPALSTSRRRPHARGAA